MAYEIGTALNPSDLLDKIRVFLIAQGWTVDAFTVEAPGKRLHMHKGAFYLNAKSSDDSSASIWVTGSGTPQIGLNVGSGYTPGTSWRDQPGVVLLTAGASVGAPVALPSGAIVSYRFDYDDTYKSMVIYIQALTGVWRSLGFGESIIKAGPWVGGAWVAGSVNYNYVTSAGGPGHGVNSPYPFGANSEFQSGPIFYVRADVDAYANKWISCSPTDTTGKGGGTNVAGGTAVQTTIPSLTGLIDRARSSLNSLSVLLPVQLFAVRDAGGLSLLGTLPNVYATNIMGMVPGQSYQQGVDWFTPFPGDVATRGTVIKRV